MNNSHIDALALNEKSAWTLFTASSLALFLLALGFVGFMLIWTKGQQNSHNRQFAFLYLTVFLALATWQQVFSYQLAGAISKQYESLIVRLIQEREAKEKEL